MVRIRELSAAAGQVVSVAGWLHHRREGGRVRFLEVRDGTGVVQCVARREALAPEVWDVSGELGLETSLRVVGPVRRDERAPGGVELVVQELVPVHRTAGYPITPKEHGVDFLMDHRHLWIRSPRQAAILRVRAALMRAVREFLDARGFVEVTAPVLTHTACEGTSQLFETRYFDQPAFLSQSGQLYNEAAIAALGRVYCFGPAFRAERSKTRRHLQEFWMVEPEMAFAGFEENLEVQEALVVHVVERVVAACAEELARVGRDPEALARVTAPFPRLSYDEALRLLRAQGLELAWGEDLGAPHETAIARAFDRPVFVHRYPARAKPFYMQPDPDQPELVLNADLLAPEGYGEIAGGSVRIEEVELLTRRMAEAGIDAAQLEWYVDLRRYGSVPHAGFGLGIERTLAWILGLEHVRETTAFPRLLYRLYP